MPRQYSVAGNCVTGTGSTTIPLACVISAATIRPKIYDLTMGMDPAPADNAFKFAFQRQTTVGTWAGAGGAAITPQALDPADPAALSSANQGVCNAGPTLTASAFLLQWAQNQRATFRWVAAPGSEMVMPATANNGLSLMALVSTANVNAAFVFLVAE